MKLRINLLVLTFFCLGIQSDLPQRGRASYYSNKFEGRKTASGEIFRQKLYTAAHKTLPFGTMVQVRNLKNDSTVVLKINDRLSKNSHNIIDLSLAGAKYLNFVKNGFAPVEINKIEK